MKPKILSVIGARPQFIKHFPLEKACKDKMDLITIHTGQHYDNNMSAVFFDQLGMRKPDYMLNIGSYLHGKQTGLMMIEIEKIVTNIKIDGLIVYGDTNSTLAGALVAAKLNIPVFHIESGLRSYNKEMPEEINRVLTDRVSDLLFVPSELAELNLKKEGVTKGVFNVGDIMKDVVSFFVEQEKLSRPKVGTDYYYATIHRPYNTDSRERMVLILENLNRLKNIVVFALHPRTDKLLSSYNVDKKNYPNIKFISPQSYADNLSYLSFSHGLITDSGGMQKEAYWLKKKCATIRKETEWVETLTGNNNKLFFEKLDELEGQLEKRNEVWEENLYGNAKSAERIANHILDYYH